MKTCEEIYTELLTNYLKDSFPEDKLEDAVKRFKGASDKLSSLQSENEQLKAEIERLKSERFQELEKQHRNGC